MLPIRTLLLPTDFSKHADYALRVAGSIAHSTGAQLIVLHVLRAAEPPGWLSDRMAGSYPWSTDGMAGLEQRLRLLRKSAPGLRAVGRVVEGSPVDQILRAVAAENCDMIVMGMHGRTGAERSAMGSVSEEVVRRAACPVLTVKDPTTVPASEPSSGEVPGASSSAPA
jgi:nucleotide-binding universal stress UspA family protein